jgi:photosystem II stability/assembly factor-like uncharacterized protein
MIKQAFVIALLWFLVSSESSGQWQQTDGPYSSTNARILAIANHTVLTATNCGLFCNTNPTEPWKLKKTTLISTSSQKGDSLFCASGGAHLIHLSDTNYTLIPFGLSGSEINVLKHTDTCLYAGTAYQGFYKSTGFTSQWTSYNQGLPADSGMIPGGGYYYFRHVYSSAHSQSYLFAGTKRGVYRTHPNTMSWNSANNGLPTSKITLLENINDTLYAVTDAELYMSLNQGDIWNWIYTAPSAITSISRIGAHLYLTTEAHGIFRSATNGSGWEPFNNGLTDMHANNIQLSSQGMLCGAQTQGVFKWVNNQWMPFNAGIICSSIIGLTSTPTHLVAYEELKAFSSSNSTTWQTINTPEIPVYPNLDQGIGSMCAKNDTLYMSYNYSTPEYPFFHHFIKYTANLGNTWHSLSNPVPYAGDDSYRILLDGNKLYAWEDEHLFCTSDLGSSWQDLSLPNNYCNMFYAFTTHKQNAFAAACGPAELLILNNNQWVLSNNGLPTDREIIFLASTPNALYAYVNVHGMFVSLEQGASWHQANTGLPSDLLIHSSIATDTGVFIATNKGVFGTNDLGLNWHSLNAGLQNTNTTAVAIINDSLFVSTYGNGVWKQALSTIHLAVPEIFTQSNHLNIHPNPTSGNILISPTLPANSSLKIVDVTGREMPTTKLDNTNSMDVSSLPNGIYILILDSKNQRYTAKFIIKR